MKSVKGLKVISDEFGNGIVIDHNQVSDKLTILFDSGHSEKNISRDYSFDGGFLMKGVESV